jgi:hypothetical protein
MARGSHCESNESGVRDSGLDPKRSSHLHLFVIFTSGTHLFYIFGNRRLLRQKSGRRRGRKR